MNFNEIRKLNELLKTIRNLKNHEEVLRWLRENKKSVRDMSEEDLEMLREHTDYDEEAWQEILRELLA